MRVAVLGLGEAGSLIASDLARAGDEVHGYDPAGVTAPDSVTLHRDAATTVKGCDLVLALPPGSNAQEALEGVLDSIVEGAVYADLSTCSPATKTALAAKADGRGALFADVALMSPVPGRGLATPALVSGSGADRYAADINARGGNVVVVGPEAGEAATRKLLRSVLMKGLAAVLIESMEAAEGAGKTEWHWNHVVEVMTALDEQMVRRLIFDTAPHARRRIDEMNAARDLLVDLGVPPTMTEATIAGLQRLVAEGMPRLSIE
jgi:3-hydroxyisobutyrate dehydrogenase-like beta-hydroxyacid dehydrogenase